MEGIRISLEEMKITLKRTGLLNFKIYPIIELGCIDLYYYESISHPF